MYYSSIEPYNQYKGGTKQPLIQLSNDIVALEEEVEAIEEPMDCWQSEPASFIVVNCN